MLAQLNACLWAEGAVFDSCHRQVGIFHFQVDSGAHPAPPAGRKADRSAPCNMIYDLESTEPYIHASPCAFVMC